MQQSRIDRIGEAVARRLESLPAGSNYLPIPRGEGARRRRKIDCEEWQEWTQRLELQRAKQPNYEQSFVRASHTAVQKIWNLLDMSSLEAGSLPPAYGFMNSAHIEERERDSRAALLMGIHLFVSSATPGRRVTFTDLVDVLARAFSPHYLERSSLVSSVRQMTSHSMASCRRDLLLRGVVADGIWSSILGWSRNPLFKIETSELGGDTVITPKLLADSPKLAALREIMKCDPALRDPPNRSLRLMPLHRPPDSAPLNDFRRANPRYLWQEVCGEFAYNIVTTSEAAERFLKIQEAVVLHFDAGAFRADYEGASQLAKRRSQEVYRKFGIKAEMSNALRPIKAKGKGRQKWIWSQRTAYVFYLSLARALLECECTGTAVQIENEKVRAKISRHLDGLRRWVELSIRSDDLAAYQIGLLLEPRMPQQPEEILRVYGNARRWRLEPAKLLAEFDAAKLHRRLFAQVDLQIRSAVEPLPIGTRFRYILSRRFHPTYLWPTHVTSRRSWVATAEPDEDSDEHEETDDAPGTALANAESLRRRWFKWHDPSTGEYHELAGCDVSSSQMQIIATLLGDESLEAVTMRRNRSFKEYMARLALECSPPVLAGDALDSYSGPDDARLQNLVKELLMRVSYGSSARQVAKDQRHNPLEFGPGWTKDGADDFVRMFEQAHPKVKLFLSACKQFADDAVQRNPCAGIVFRNPLDRCDVRWNPIKTNRTSLDFGKSKAYWRVPASYPDSSGEYAVDAAALRRLVMPCLIHMLDAYYSALVMGELSRRGCRAFVGIHDCWLVPVPDMTLLKESMPSAARVWYLGLGCVYEDLLNHARGRPEHVELIDAARSKWKERCSAGYVPQFKAKDTGA